MEERPKLDALRRITADSAKLTRPVYSFPSDNSPTVRSSGDGHAVVRFSDFDLRPEHQTRLEEVFLIADAPFSETTPVRWVATAKNIDALAEGTFALPLSESPTETDPDSSSSP